MNAAVLTRLRQLEVHAELQRQRRSPAPAEQLSEAEVIAIWLKLRDDPHPPVPPPLDSISANARTELYRELVRTGEPRPFDPDFERMSPAEAADAFKRSLRPARASARLAAPAA